ncbi:DUF2000 domain-containing protein [Burkholderia stabilis]|uniref:DUF2000 domain-containing protein n=1 Tax=Burkholderia stabilis TaxID=95485 RepID=A0A1Y1BS22_9BURK|nr:DUF2000 domain-containing protein [Burkholderia stabilis]BAX62832.1 hypothetical protein BSFP_057000 [Burkholderia stabilis]
MYLDNSSKTVLVVNAEFPAPTILNAVAHTTLGLAAANAVSAWNLLPYPSPAFSIESRISEYPVIVLRSKRSSPLERLVLQLKGMDIVHNAFIDSMLGMSAVEQQSATLSAEPGKNRIVCVGLFGAESEIRPLIKSFSLYKTSDSLAHAAPSVEIGSMAR